MAKKKPEENPAGLNEEELAAEAEMIAEEPLEEAEVVAEEEATGDETLSDPEPKAEGKPAESVAEHDPEPAKPDPTTVPLAALDSERHKRKEAEGRLAVLEDKMATLTAPKPAEAPEEMPDPVVDPDGFKGWLARRELAQAQPVQQMTAQMRQQQEHNQLRNFAAASESTFTTDNADYPKALEFARELRGKEFLMWGYSPEQIPQLVSHAEMQVATLARERGVSPAKIVYDYAKLHGYKAEASPGAGNVAMREEMAGDKIERLADVQKKTQSTAGAGGTAREEEWTPERISRLSDKEMDKLPEDVFKRVMGG